MGYRGKGKAIRRLIVRILNNTVVQIDDNGVKGEIRISERMTVMEMRAIVDDGFSFTI